MGNLRSNSGRFIAFDATSRPELLMVRKGGLEPPHPCGHKNLNPEKSTPCFSEKLRPNASICIRLRSYVFVSVSLADSTGYVI